MQNNQHNSLQIAQLTHAGKFTCALTVDGVGHVATLQMLHSRKLRSISQSTTQVNYSHVVKTPAPHTGKSEKVKPTQSTSRSQQQQHQQKHTTKQQQEHQKQKK
jgi:hypothetical protein